MTKTAFIAIVGKPNVGKSSILNRLLGQKIAIVSSKPQTTRTKIMGVLTQGETQLVFTDTPGFHKAHNKLGEKMNEAVGDTVGGVDACLFQFVEYAAQFLFLFGLRPCRLAVGFWPVEPADSGKPHRSGLIFRQMSRNGFRIVGDGA